MIVGKAGSQRTYVTPTAAVDFIERFDSAMPDFESSKPFSFTLDESEKANSRHKPGKQRLIRSPRT